MINNIKQTIERTSPNQNFDKNKKYLSENNVIDFVSAFNEQKYYEWNNIYFNGYLELREVELNNKISINDCYIKELSIKKCENVKEIYIVNSTINELIIEGTQIDVFHVVHSNFLENVGIRASIFTNVINLSGCKFHGDVFISGKLFEKSNFNNSIFYGRVKFKGSRTVFLTTNSENQKPDEIYKLFGAETHLNDVTFMMPDKVIFDGVNLKNAHLLGTNPKNITFTDIDWYQEALGRNGLYDEVFMNSGNEDFKKYYLPKLESAYRSFRVALEVNKDFSSAKDFYIGEMECKRKQIDGILRRNLFSLEAIYLCLSYYGTSPLRAFSVLLLMAFIHLLSTGVDHHCFFSPSSCDIKLGQIVRTINVLTLRNIALENNYVDLIDSIFRIIVPVQIALFGLALRSKIKRN